MWTSRHCAMMPFTSSFGKFLVEELAVIMNRDVTDGIGTGQVMPCAVFVDFILVRNCSKD